MIRGGLEPSWNNDLALATLQTQPWYPELYQELWWYSGGYASLSSNTGNVWCLAKSSTSPNNSATAIYTHNFPSSTPVALEVAGALAGGTVRLYDVTSSTDITASNITSSASMTVFRSGQFTLTQGHKYAVRLVSIGSAMNVTDASLIVFPSVPLATSSVSAISLANPSGSTLKEAYISLWVHSSGGASNAYSTVYYLQKGSASYASSITSATKLHTLSTAWSPTQKFALEVSMENPSAGGVAYAELYDTNTNSAVSGSLISTNSNTYTLIRSGSFNLTGGHSYAVAFYQNGTGTALITKAHLVALSN